MIRPYLVAHIHALLPDGRRFDAAPRKDTYAYLKTVVARFPRREWCFTSTIMCNMAEYEIHLMPRGFLIRTYVHPTTIWPRVVEFILLTGVRTDGIEAHIEWLRGMDSLIDYLHLKSTHTRTRAEAVHSIRRLEQKATL